MVTNLSIRAIPEDFPVLNAVLKPSVSAEYAKNVQPPQTQSVVKEVPEAVPVPAAALIPATTLPQPISAPKPLSLVKISCKMVKIKSPLVLRGLYH